MDESNLLAVADFIARHKNLAGFVLGLFVFFESLIFIGAFVPATPLLFVAGGLIATQSLGPVSVIAWCVAGAALGDAVSYSIGRRLGSRALLHPSLLRHRRTLARARLLTRRLGPTSIYLGRFLGPMRAFVPAAAGMLRMPARAFQIANVGSAFTWVLVMLAPGYFGVRWIERLLELDEAVVWAVLAVALVVAVSVAVWRTLRRTTPRLTAYERRKRQTLTTGSSDGNG
jgi:membrane protein DedA with SNARE-associated domain